MSVRARMYRLLNIAALLGLLLSPAQPLAVGAGLAPARGGERAAVVGRDAISSHSQLFRTRVTVRTPADWTRLERLGVVVLEEARHGFSHGYTDGAGEIRASVPESVSVLATADQLEALARLRFEPRGTDELGALVMAHAQAKPWLAAAWAEVQRSRGAEGQRGRGAEVNSPLLPRSLAPELRSALAALTSVDDDADGLTNTQKEWWCTDP